MFDHETSNCRRGVGAGRGGPGAQRLCCRFRLGELLDADEHKSGHRRRNHWRCDRSREVDARTRRVAGRVAPGTFQDVNAAGELLWWTPQPGLVTPGTSFVYPTNPTLPFNISSNFFPNGPGGSDGGDVGFTSAILSGTFDAPAGGSVTFTLGSDDDAWVFLNGQLVVDNGDVHATRPLPQRFQTLWPEQIRSRCSLPIGTQFRRPSLSTPM